MHRKWLEIFGMIESDGWLTRRELHIEHHRRCEEMVADIAAEAASSKGAPRQLEGEVVSVKTPLIAAADPLHEIKNLENSKPHNEKPSHSDDASFFPPIRTTVSEWVSGIRVAPGRPKRRDLLTREPTPGVESSVGAAIQGVRAGSVKGETVSAIPRKASDGVGEKRK